MEYKTENDKTDNQQNAESLLAIYEDYLWIVRQHEQFMLLTLSDNIAEMQKERMYPEGYEFPWKITELDENEKQEFADFCANDISGSNNKSYVVLQHIVEKENNCPPPAIAFPPYSRTTMGFNMPSTIERCTVCFPNNITLGNTEFLVDGRYKVVYTGEAAKDKTIYDCISNPDLFTEFSVMLKLSEAYRKNGYVKDEKFERAANDIYAEEMIAVNENNILELIGSFAETVKGICNEKYEDKSNPKNNKKSSYKNFIKAKKDGFLQLPDNFWDYVNIRHFIRHQWETLNELESYMPKQVTDEENKRSERARSYLKFFGKPMFLRMRGYVDVLHQMQKVICEIDPDRLIRDKDERYGEFVKRVREAYQQNPNRQLKVEINYPLPSDKFLLIYGDMQKISPDIMVADDVCVDREDFSDMFERMENYKKRSNFLETFHDLESYAIEFCIMHGRNCNSKGNNLTVRDAWDYLEEKKVISREECEKWHEYTDLRRDISHFYFNENLKDKLDAIEEKYPKDWQELANKITDAGPNIKKIRDGVYEYTNTDGNVVELDRNRHKILSGFDEPKPQDRKPRRNNRDSDTHWEDYSNGVSYELNAKNWVESVKLPNGVEVNFKENSIDFDERTHWYPNAEAFNALKTVGSIVMTDKDLAVLRYKVGSDSVDFENKDRLLIDYTHTLWLDCEGRLKRFEYKQSKDNIIIAEFRKTQKGKNLIELNDGTSVLINGKNMTVFHGDYVLRNNARIEFAKSYDKAPMLLNKFIKRGYGR